MIIDLITAIYGELGLLVSRHESSLIESAVQKAAANMDEFRPGWYKEIDKEALDIFRPNRCILAQTIGSYSLGMDLYLQQFVPKGVDRDDPEYHQYCCAFAISPAKPFWIAEIDARLEADKKAATGRFLAKTYEIINLPAIIRKEEVSIER
jgi:hypothetical protein